MFEEFWKFWKRIRKKKNVVGYSKTLKPRIRNGVIVPGEQVLRVYVSKKAQSIQEYNELKKTGNLVPEKFQDIPTDVVEIGELRALPEYRERIRPVKAGISAMGVWKGSTACTLGNFAKSTKKGEEDLEGYIANCHCAANCNKAPIGTKYIQPSPYDGGKPETDTIGTFCTFLL